MPQVLKAEVEQRIAEAALEVFARRGFRTATMARIARRAGVATGNLYRYHPDKEGLFRAVVPPGFPQQLVEGLRRRIRALSGVGDVRALPAGAPWRVVSEDLLRFCIENRLRVVIVLGKAADTPHAGFARHLVGRLTSLALAHFRSVRPGLRVTRVLRATLDRAYRGFVAAMVEVLEENDDEATIRAGVAAYESYHLAGLKALMESDAR